MDGDMLTIAGSARTVRADYGVMQLDGAGVGALSVALIAAGEPVGSHVHHGYWREIGRHDDYEDARAEVDVMLPELLPA